jgi:ABC-2 type transport system ATP-binding protein
LEEVEAVCTRAIIIDRGRIVANGTPESLKGRAPGAGAILLRVSGRPASALAPRLEKLAGVSVVEVVAESPALLRLVPEDSGAARELAAEIHEAAVADKWRLEELRVEEGRLDDVFRAITRPDGSGGGRS